LARYTSTSSAYAFNTYDHQGPVDDPLSASDVLMANLLSLQLSARDVVPLFMDGDEAPQRLRLALDHALISLRDAPPFESYESVDALEEAVSSLAATNEAAIPVKWWTAITVSKVLHRRRPHIVSLIDSRVCDFWERSTGLPTVSLTHGLGRQVDVATYLSTHAGIMCRPLDISAKDPLMGRIEAARGQL